MTAPLLAPRARGELSSVIAKSGVDIGAPSAFVFPLVGVASAVAAFMSPFLFKAGGSSPAPGRRGRRAAAGHE